jgi:hypothetical protein
VRYAILAPFSSPPPDFLPLTKHPDRYKHHLAKSLGLARVIRNLVNYNYSATVLPKRRYLSIFVFSGAA